MTDEHPYAALTPDIVLAAVDSTGLDTDARILPLNSYENRVYQVGIEDSEPVVVKFYRPGRWTTEQILEEHEFARELAELDVPVVAPWRDAEGRSLFEYEGFRLAVYRRYGGRAPDLENEDDLLVIGRLLGRLHAVGSQHSFVHRPELTVQTFGVSQVDYVLEHDWVPEDLRPAYEAQVFPLLEAVSQRFAECEFARVRLHGDCHPGNLLWRDGAGHFVDLDDARNGPVVQDLWMLATGDRADQTLALSTMLEGYEQFQPFPRRQLSLIEPLRALRSLHYTGWLARRWDDPSFPRFFPHFGDARYWGEHINLLREHRAAMDEPTLMV